MLRCLFLILAATSLVVAERIKERFLHDNQIMFRESGVVVNKAVFFHVRFTMEMGPTLDAIQEIDKKLRDVNEAERKNSDFNVLPYLMGSEGNDSIWRQNEAAELWRKRALDGVAITGMLHNMFNRTARQLSDSMGIIPKKYDVNKGTRFHERQKRFAGMIWAGINMGRIDNLEKSFQNFTRKYNQLIDYVQELSGKHIQLAVDVALLKDLVLLLNHKNYHKIITMMVGLTDQLKDTVTEVRAISREGRRGRIAEEMLGGNELINFYTMIEEKARQRGCKMVMESPEDVYELDATYGYDNVNRTFIVYLHVPMYQIGEELKLWEYVPFPILQSLTLNATIMPQTGKENFIALMPDASIRTDSVTPPHKFRIMNKYDLEICKKMRGVYMCGGRNTLRTDITNSCIGNLYLRDHEGIARTCDLEIGKLEEYVAKTGPNEWIVFSPKPFLETATCGKESESIKFEIQTIVELPEDCKINLRSTQLTTDININIEYKIQRFDWKYDGNIFSELEIDDKDLAVLMQDMIATKSKFGLKDLNHLKHYFEVTENGLMKVYNYVKDKLDFLSALGDITTVAGIVIVTVIIFLLCTRFGFFTKIITVIRGSSNIVNIPAVGAQLREAIAERNAGIREDRRELFPHIVDIELNHLREVSPPPYMAEYLPSSPPVTGTIRRTDSTLSIDSRFEPSNIREERQTGGAQRECNIGPVVERGLRRDSFVCTQHPTEGRPNLCAGYYSLPRNRPRSVRFESIEEV